MSYLLYFSFPFVEESKKQIVELNPNIADVDFDDLKMVGSIFAKIVKKDYAFFDNILLKK